MVGDTTDGLPWKKRAVTFVQNHDLGYRTHEDGTPQKDHESDRFANNWQVEQAYAYVLTHPGVPMRFLETLFRLGPDLRNKIKALINARKVAGVHPVAIRTCRTTLGRDGVYAARVAGRDGELYVRVGAAEGWQPTAQGYADYREYATGAGWKRLGATAGQPAGSTGDTQAGIAGAGLSPVPEHRHPG